MVAPHGNHLGRAEEGQFSKERLVLGRLGSHLINLFNNTVPMEEFLKFADNQGFELKIL